MSETVQSIKKTRISSVHSFKSFFSLTTKGKNKENTEVISSIVTSDAGKMITDAIGATITSWFASEENENTMCRNEPKQHILEDTPCVPRKSSLRKRIVKGLRMLFRMK